MLNDPLCFPSLTLKSMQSFPGAAQRLADPREIQKVRDDLPINIFSGSDNPVGQKLEGVRVLIDRYRSAGVASIAHDFYSGGRHEMLNEINRRDAVTNLLVWLSGIQGVRDVFRRPCRGRRNLGAKYQRPQHHTSQFFFS